MSEQEDNEYKETSYELVPCTASDINEFYPGESPQTAIDISELE